MFIGKFRSKRGQAAILISISLVVTLGLLGLVVDVGWAYWRREAATTAAESAALAAAVYANANFTSFTTCSTGSSGLVCQSATACPASPASPPTSTVGAGCLYAKQNGFINSGNQTMTMAANNTSSPVTGVSPAYWISATASETIYQTFSAILGQSAGKVSAKAVAGVFSTTGSGCFYMMGSTGTDLSMSGGAINSNCGAYINSTDPAAINQSGGSVTVTGGGQVYNRGGYDHSGGSITPAPVAGGVVTDPFASLPVPTIGACTDSGISVSSGTATLSNGVHCGSVSVSGGTLTLAAGLHVFKSGMSMGVSGGSVVDDGKGGVTLFMDGSDGITTSGGSLDIHAPTAAGTYKGVVIFYARSNTDDVNLSGGSVTLSGAVYAPDSTFDMSGGTFTNVTLVVKILSPSGGTATFNGAANTNYTSGGGAAISLIQ